MPHCAVAEYDANIMDLWLDYVISFEPAGDRITADAGCYHDYRFFHLDIFLWSGKGDCLGPTEPTY